MMHVPPEKKIIFDCVNLEFRLTKGEKVRDKINLEFFSLSAAADFVMHSHHEVWRRW